MSIENSLTKNDLIDLVKIAGEITSQINQNDLFQLILNKAGELTDSPDGALILYDKDRDSLYFAGALGKNSDMLLKKYGEFAEEQIPVKGSKAGGVFESGKSLIVKSLKGDLEHYKKIDDETRQPTESMVCVPLQMAGENKGVMQLLNKRIGEYNNRDQILLENFAIYATIALRNANLFEGLIAHMGLYTSHQSNGGIEELFNQLKSPARVEKLTILFADLRGYRVLCQTINDPAKILAMTSKFVIMLSEQVLINGGIVNKFLGDGILAFFRDGDFAKRAVNSAFSMIAEFEKLKASWNDENSEQLEFLDIGFGITTDNVIIGTIGNSKVRDFTAIGTAVNLAAAFEKAARGGKRVLVDQLTYLAVKDILFEYDGPFNYELRQSDQRGGNIYKQYHLKKLSFKKPSKVFISHSQKDRLFVEEELIPLLNDMGIDNWYSKNDIKGGQSWVNSIYTAMDSCNFLFVIISNSSADSNWVKDEIDMAAARSYLRNKIIPIKIDDTKLENVNSFLLDKQSIDARNKDKFYLELKTIFS